ncbi:RNA polymerase sigma-70 factor [uncultured Chitinophaga sp.]|jgi:RNA polymerase sigma-70 factor, Bacteroides expansion family 1|uniref:RNA polymerase sigma-70 factor n=1 Tax=uncultured Chitinophaga sp. TaxID=339340 RepID=UPI00261CB30B|nr:RNA polymerase sigma-70 factor [uncultured Chitinophaga sp.]
MKETDLIAALKKGEEAALRQLFEQLYPRLCYFARGILQHDMEAEDVVQEAFMKLWRHRQQFNSFAAVRSFLYISARHACLNILKHQRVVHRHGAGLQAEAADELTVAHRLIEAEVAGQLREALNKLPPGCRQVVELGYLEGMRNHEIASQLRVSVNTIKTQKARGLYLLKGWFKAIGILLLLL